MNANLKNHIKVSGFYNMNTYHIGSLNSNNQQQHFLLLII